MVIPACSGVAPYAVYYWFLPFLDFYLSSRSGVQRLRQFVNCYRIDVSSLLHFTAKRENACVVLVEFAHDVSCMAVRVSYEWSVQEFCRLSSYIGSGVHGSVLLQLGCWGKLIY